MTNINEFDCQGGSPNQYFFEFRILTILDNANAVILIGYEIDQGSSDNVSTCIVFHEAGNFSVHIYSLSLHRTSRILYSCFHNFRR